MFVFLSFKNKVEVFNRNHTKRIHQNILSSIHFIINL